MRTSPLTPIAVTIAIAVPVSACGDATENTPTTDTKTTASTVETDPATATCSASGLNLTLPKQANLPAPVAATREKLFTAAKACDFDALGALALENPNFGFTYGGEKDPVAYWHSVDTKQRTMERLARLLTSPYVKRVEGGATYAWPSAYQDAPTPKDYADLVATGAYSRAEVAAFEKDGSYYGYRIALNPDGTWNFFLAGD